MSDLHTTALRRLVLAFEKDFGGVWIDYVEDEEAVAIHPIGNCDLPSIGEAYVTACLALDHPIMAEAPYGGGAIDPAEALRLVGLPRRK